MPLTKEDLPLVKLVGYENQFAAHAFGIGIRVTKGENKGAIKVIGNPSSCRAYVADNILYNKMGMKPNTQYVWTEKVNLTKTKLYLVVTFRGPDSNANINNALSCIDFLHSKEKQAGVCKTRVYATNNPNVFIFQPNWNWLKSSWKYLLYSFYVKQIAYGKDDMKKWEPEKWAVLDRKDNEAIFLKNIKSHMDEEVFDKSVYNDFDYGAVHTRSGFYAIGSGDNPVMAQKLGIHV